MIVLTFHFYTVIKVSYFNANYFASLLSFYYFLEYSVIIYCDTNRKFLDKLVMNLHSLLLHFSNSVLKQIEEHLIGKLHSCVLIIKAKETNKTLKTTDQYPFYLQFKKPLSPLMHITFIISASLFDFQ